jgi:hypothetical protein
MGGVSTDGVAVEARNTGGTLCLFVRLRFRMWALLLTLFHCLSLQDRLTRTRRFERSRSERGDPGQPKGCILAAISHLRDLEPPGERTKWNNKRSREKGTRQSGDWSISNSRKLRAGRSCHNPYWTTMRVEDMNSRRLRLTSLPTQWEPTFCRYLPARASLSSES